MFTHYNNRQLAEDLEKKLLLYSNTNYVEDFGQYFNKERYEKFVNIIINKYCADIKNLINQLVRYYKSGIEFKDGKLSFDYSEVHLLGSLLYKKLFYIDSETAFSQYLELIKTKVHGDMERWLDIYFDNDGIKNNFLDNATDYIIEHQNKEWITEFSKIDYKRYSWLPNIKNIPEVFHDNNQLYFWLKGDYRHTKEEVLHFIGNSLISSLLQKVILLESYNTQQINRNRILNILDACQNDYITVGTILVHNDIKLNVFLLTQFDYSLFAFLNLYDIDSASHGLSDSEINYTQQWEEIVTKQLVNIFFMHFRSHNKEQFSVMLFHTINNLAVRYFYNTNNFKIKNTFFTVLEKTSKFQRKLYSEKEYLFDIVISDLVSKQLSNLIYDDNFKIENLFILSYYLEQINTKSKIFNSDYSALSDSIINGILEYIEVVLTNNNLHIGDLDNLEKINFGLMYELSSNKKDWLKIIDLNLTMEQWQNIIDEEKIKKGLSSSDPRKPREVVEIYFQILLIIFKEIKDNKIAKIISSLAIKFGLKIEYGIFDDSPWKNNQLYVKYIEALNVFEDSLFEDFINNLQKHKRLKDMLKLLSYTVAINRQKNIQSKIKVLAKNVSEDNISYFDMREAIQYEMHSDFDDLATNLITIYQDKIEKTGYKHKEKEFYEIVCRKELLDIFYSDIIVLNDKFNQLNAYKIPFDDRNHGIESRQKRCENYKTFIRALLFFETEPIKTYKILSDLIEKELNSIYLINMVNAYFQATENDVNKEVKFKYILNEYEKYDSRFQDRKKSLYEYQVLFYGYSIIGDIRKLEKLHQEIPQHNKEHIKNYLPTEIKLFDKVVKIKSKVVVCVEGEFDIKFIKNINKAVEEYRNIIDLEKSNISFIPLGGSNLKKWVKNNHLEDSNIIELHIYDSDIGESSKNENKYKKECEEVKNRKDNSYCFLTKKREMENYIHRSLIKEHFKVDMSQINDWDMEDIPTYIYNKSRQYKEKDIKEILNGKLSRNMTKKLLEKIDAFEELKQWFEKIKELSKL